MVITGKALELFIYPRRKMVWIVFVCVWLQRFVYDYELKPEYDCVYIYIYIYVIKPEGRMQAFRYEG